MQQIGSGWSAEDKEDLVQTTAIKVVQWVASHDREPNHTFAFLRKSAHNAMVDEIRKRQRRREEPLVDKRGQQHDIPAPSPDPVRVVISQELGRAIQDCLASLVRDRRRAMALRLLGHTNREIGQRMEWVAKKTENLVYRALQDMRRCLAEKGLSQ